MRTDDGLNCPDCGLHLAESVYTAALLKSCALCSRIAERHIFHPLAAFGTWHTANAEGGLPYPQSECVALTSARRTLEVGQVTTRAPKAIRELLPFPAPGPTCAQVYEAGGFCGGQPQSSTYPAIAEALLPLREEAADALASRDGHPPSPPRGAAAIEKPAPRPTVFRRRAGQVQAAEVR